MGKLKLKYTIRVRLVTTAFGILAMLLAIVVITKIFIDGSLKQYATTGAIDKILNYELRLRKAEKNFLIKDIIDPKFYQTGKTPYIETFDKTHEHLAEELHKLSNSKLICQSRLQKQTDSLKQAFRQYHKTFYALITTIKEKGFKDYGLIGQMREQIHKVESQIKQTKDLKANIYMLTLRRHEKDYLIRKDLKYQQKFNIVANKFVSYLSQNNKNKEFNHEHKNTHRNYPKGNRILIAEILNYGKKFQNIIEKDKHIGLNNEAGLTKKLNRNIQKIEQLLAHIQTTVKKQARANTSKSMALLFIVMSILSAAILAMLLRASTHIVKSTKSLSKYINRLGNGELPQKITIQGNDEITEMKNSINTLTQNLKNTKDFAVAVGNGNFSQEINVFNNQGELGGALVEMRKKLLQVSQEKEKQEQENKIRMWTNEGVGVFSEILRKHSNLNSLCHHFLKKLVQYTGMNQGALFMLEGHSQGKIYSGHLRMVAAYAYERTKHIHKKIAVGDGLIGTCAIEKEKIYLTDIPQNYINITSGLGDAPPNTILALPAKTEERLLGVIELAGFQPLPPHKIDFAQKVATDFASVLDSLKTNETTARLLQKSETQAQELAAQEEELRQNMEELTATQETMEKREEELQREIQQLKQQLNNTVITPN